MKSVFRAGIAICLFLNLQVKAQPNFTEIYLPDPSESETYVNNLSDKKTVLSGSIGINKVQDENLYSEIIPHHKLYFGNVSVYEDKTSFSTIQNEKDVGIKLRGGGGLLNYSTGIYNIEKAGAWASVNPLHFVPEAGRFDIGGGFFTNRLGVEDETNQENTLSFFTGYKFKRFSTRGEFRRINHPYSEDIYYDSWHLTNKLGITKNLRLKAGFEEYEQTNAFSKDFGVEYNIGNLQIELETSIIRYQSEEDRDSERFGFNTKYSF